MRQLAMTLLREKFAVCRLEPQAPMPDWVGGRLVSITRTPAELSILCESSRVPADVANEGAWRALEVDGPLAFSMVGVLSAIVNPLAEAGVSVFVMSTFDTDYVLMHEEDVETSVAALLKAGHEVGTGP